MKMCPYNKKKQQMKICPYNKKKQRNENMSLQ